MSLLRYSVYLTGLALYPLRFACYLVHSLLVFISKPGTRALVPIVVAIGMFAGWHAIMPLIRPIAEMLWASLSPHLEPALAQTLYPLREIVLAAVAFVAATIAYIALSRIIRPILAAFPTPARPLPPAKPFIVPKFKVKAVPVRMRVPALPHGRYRGNIAKIERRYPAPIRELLARRDSAPRYDAPTRLARFQQPEPDLVPVPAPTPAAPAAAMPNPAPPEPKRPPSTPTTAQSATRRPTRNPKGAPPAPPPPAPKRNRATGT